MFTLPRRLSYALPLILFGFFYPQLEVIEGVPSKKKKMGGSNANGICACVAWNFSQLNENKWIIDSFHGSRTTWTKPWPNVIRGRVVVTASGRMSFE